VLSRLTGPCADFSKAASPAAEPFDPRDGAYDMESSSESEASDAPVGATKKRASNGGGASKPRKRIKAEGTTDDDSDDDEAYTGEGDPHVENAYRDREREKPAKKRSGASSASRTSAEKRGKVRHSH
jgi:hypothetical protein